MSSQSASSQTVPRHARTAHPGEESARGPTIVPAPRPRGTKEQKQDVSSCIVHPVVYIM